MGRGSFFCMVFDEFSWRINGLLLGCVPCLPITVCLPVCVGSVVACDCMLVPAFVELMG